MTLPPDYPRIRLVGSLHELITTPFAEGINAICSPRTLVGDFAEVLRHVTASEETNALDEAFLEGLSLSPAGQTARQTLLADQRTLREHGLAPILDCIRGYPRDEDPGPVPTDVFSFHVDSATCEAETYLCTYFGPSSEGLRNDQAQRRVEIPETRAELLRCFGGPDDEAFREYLSENCYDLHYAPLPGATPFIFGLGNIWKIAVDHPGSPVPPCIHRAPTTLPQAPPRLLLIS